MLAILGVVCPNPACPHSLDPIPLLPPMQSNKLPSPPYLPKGIGSVRIACLQCGGMFYYSEENIRPHLVPQPNLDQNQDIVWYAVEAECGEEHPESLVRFHVAVNGTSGFDDLVKAMKNGKLHGMCHLGHPLSRDGWNFQREESPLAR